MKAEEVKNLTWVPVTNWKRLTKTSTDIWGNYTVSKQDIECFVEKIFNDVAKKLNISYKELKPILREENSNFYLFLERIFHGYSGLEVSNIRLIELENILRIPDTSKIYNRSNVERILSDFSNLTDLEKIEVLQKLGKFSIEVKKIE